MKKKLSSCAPALLFVLLSAFVLSGPSLAQPAPAPAPAVPAVATPAPAAAPVAAAPTVPAVDPAMPVEVPKTPGEVIEQSKKIVETVKAKQWFAVSAGVIWILLFLIKLGRDKLDFMKKMSRRWLYIIVGGLSVAAFLLARFQQEMSLSSALTVLMSGPAAAFLNDFIKRGVLGKEPTSES